MKVHIVCHDYEKYERSILARLAMALIDHTNWTIGKGPDPRADINYFFPYIEYAERHAGFNETMTAAYFTHYENDAWDIKRRWWNLAAQDVDLRITTSSAILPMLEPHGLTRLASHPPVDRNKFNLRRRAKHDKPVIGLSGFVDIKSGRKGEHLVRKLAQKLDCASLRAIGHGWPVATRLVPLSEIPKFYNEIDFFLCASTNEGIPMTMFEALTCGTPVIVPAGVGVVDDLPDMPGIYKFECNNSASLYETVMYALDDKRSVSRRALRDVTRDYTELNWTQEHRIALEDLMYAPAIQDSLPDWRGNSGAYVVAFGEPSRRCAMECIEAFKKHMPDVPVALASTEPLGPEDIFIQREDTDIGGRVAKLAAYTDTPPEWRYVLYLDADTEPVEDVSFLYQILADGWEAVICKDMDKYHHVGMMRRPDNGAETDTTIEFIGTDKVFQYNGGMFAFRRCDATEKFFAAWNEEWQRWAARDQGALLRALYSHPLKLFLLFNQWNATDRYPAPGGKVAIWHHNTKARRWARSIKGRTDGTDAWRAVDEWNAKAVKPRL